MPALLRTLSDRPAETVSLPSGVLFALSAAPVGGIKESTLVDTPPPADHVLVRLPELPSSRPIPKTDSVDIAASRRVDLPGQIVATTFQRSPAASASASESQRSKLSTLLSQGIRQLMNSSYTSALDALFGMAQWLEETALQAPRSSSFSEELPAQEESADFEGRGSALLPETTQVPNASDQVLVNGLAALAILAVARPENKKQRAEIKGRGLAVRNQK